MSDAGAHRMEDEEKRIDSLRAALNLIAYSRWSTETPGQFVEVLQKMARDALIVDAAMRAKVMLAQPAPGTPSPNGDQPALPVAWQQTTADGEPLWGFDNFLSTPRHFAYSRPLYASPVQATPARVDEGAARQLAQEAIESIEDWAGYASDYFREKHRLAEQLAAYRERLADLSPAALSLPDSQMECFNIDCGWRGPLSECLYIANVSPHACPRCRETAVIPAPGHGGTSPTS